MNLFDYQCYSSKNWHHQRIIKQFEYRRNMKRKPCLKDQSGNVLMTPQNVKTCLRNQEDSYENLDLNESLHLQYYGFKNISNLTPFVNLHTLFLNNNVIEQITNLESLNKLKTLNLSYNRITEIKGLKQNKELYTLDLSNNQIQLVPGEQIQNLICLSHFKLSHNKLSNFQSLKGLKVLKKSLTFLDLASNQLLDYDPLIYTEVLSQLNVTVLTLNQTNLSRNTSNYRKQTILAVKTLKFLDERPVTSDERMLIEAWKEGGLKLEKQVREKIRQRTVDKHRKIYCEIEERNKQIEEKRMRVLNKLTHKEAQLLESLQKERKSQQYDILTEDEKTLLNLRIEQLSKYIELMSEAIKYIDLDQELSQGKVKLPTMLIDQQTPEAIYVYNISPEQLPLVIEKYYPDQVRPVLAVSRKSEKELKWVKEYDQILHQTFQQSRGSIDLLAPLFNLAIFEFDESMGRKVRRFDCQELKIRLTLMRQEEEKRQKSIQALYELD